MSNTENQNQTDPKLTQAASAGALALADPARTPPNPPRQRADESDTSYISVFQNEQSFEAAQRMAKALSSSDIVPVVYQGQAKMGNCLIALEISQRNRVPVLTVMQNLNIIHGRPSWSSQYVIAALNTCGRFEPLEFEWTGVEGEDTWGCRASTTVKRTGRPVKGALITMAMVKAEGWLNKTGSKWKTMPEQMFIYRAASFFGKIYAPEVLNGMQTAEEEQDIIDIPSANQADRAALPSSVRPALPETAEATAVPTKSTKADKGVKKAAAQETKTVTQEQKTTDGEGKAAAPTQHNTKAPEVRAPEAQTPPPNEPGQQVGNEPAVTPPPTEEKPAPAPAVEAPAAETPAPAPTGTVAWKEVNVVEVKTGTKASNKEKVWILRTEGEVAGRVYCELAVAQRDGEPPLGGIWIDTEIRTSPESGTKGTPDYKPAKENTYITAWKQIEI